MKITTSQKTVYHTTDGKEHAGELDAVLHETRMTLNHLGMRSDTAANMVGLKPDTLRAIAETLVELANAKDRLNRARRGVEAADVGDLSQWPADANVAPRKGERTLDLEGEGDV